MAVTAGNTLSLDEWIRRLTKDETRAIIEVAAQSNRALSSMMVSMGNETEGNTTTLRTDYPSGTWTSMNEGVGTEASHTEEVFDAAGTLEGYSAINKRYVDRAPDAGAARAQEEAAFAIGYGENVEGKVFNGDRSLFPKEFTGFVARYNTLSGSDTAGQVVDGGGSSSTCTDLWFVGWGERKVALFFGKNQTGGLNVTDMGLRPWDGNGDGTHIQAYVKHHEWTIGLKLEDYRSVARVANIETVGDTSYGGLSGVTALVDLMLDGWYKIPTKLRDGGMKIYCNRNTVAALHKEARLFSQHQLAVKDYAGVPTVHFLDIPIMETDSITDTNTNIS